jgi:hypothetical protein
MTLAVVSVAAAVITAVAPEAISIESSISTTASSFVAVAIAIIVAATVITAIASAATDLQQILDIECQA